MTAPATTHTGPTEINGRPAEDYELEVRQRAYEAQRKADAEQLNIRHPVPLPDPRDLVALVRSLPPLPWEKP